MLLAAGCARFSTHQYDIREDTKRGTKTTVETTAAGWTFFSARSSLATWKATQSEKTQGAAVGGLEQIGGVDSNLVSAAVNASVSAAVKAVKP